VRFEETEKRRQEVWIAGALAKFVSPDSGQVDEPPGPPVITKRCRKRSETKRNCIVWA
jgi:hypothetical protein